VGGILPVFTRRFVFASGLASRPLIFQAFRIQPAVRQKAVEPGEGFAALTRRDIPAGLLFKTGV